jgi:asparagine synthase (glutamine-hydrolysing)
MQEVSQEMKVVLAGDGGDELFGGYTWYDKYLFYKRFDPIAPLIQTLHRAVQDLNTEFQRSLLQSAEWRLELAGLKNFDQYQTGMYPPLDEPDRKLILEDPYVQDSKSSDPVRKYAKEDMSMKDLQYLDFHTFLPNDILAKVDRASMAHSLEVRVPFLDRPVAEFSFSLDDSVLHPSNEKKHLLKSASRKLLPDEIIERPKSGFGAPVSQMGFVDEYVDVLRESEAAADGVLSQSGLDEYLERNPRSNNVFKLVLFELWYRRWRDKSSGQSDNR